LKVDSSQDYMYLDSEIAKDFMDQKFFNLSINLYNTELDTETDYFFNFTLPCQREIIV